MNPKALLVRMIHQRNALTVALVLFMVHTPEVHAGWLDPLKNKARDAIEPIAFIGFCYGVGKLFAKDFASGLFAMAAAILLYNAESILNSLR